MAPPQRPLHKKFWERVDKNGPDHPALGRCWIFNNATEICPYGNLWHNKRQWRANRVSWLLNRGAIPEGMFVLHHCDNPACVNPNHLFLGDYQANHEDMDRKNRRAASELTNHPGEENGRAILTEEQVIQILQWPLNYSGKLKDFTKGLGVCKGTVEAIRSGRLWNHLYLKYHSRFQK